MNPSWDNASVSPSTIVAGLFMCLLIAVQTVLLGREDVHAQPKFPASTSSESDASESLEVTADRTEFYRDAEEFKAFGSVTVRRGIFRLTADQAVLHALSGQLRGKGRVHLSDRGTDVWAEDLTVNVNTEAWGITNGKIFLKESNAWVRGRLLQRFSETHYRVKDGTFTTCDADDGQIPDWSFSFQDVDVERGDGLFAKNVWLNVRNHPILPLPLLRYPMPGARKTGFLVPTAGFDNVFGVQYRQGWYWAISPSQDLTVTPQILSKRGQGVDLDYRYVLSRRSRGTWLVNAFNDTREDHVRAQITGAHVHHVHDDLLLQTKVNYATDRTLLQSLSTSGVVRALPSQESVLNLTYRTTGGKAYLMAQYLQPLGAGGRRTFQRLPEIGHRYRRVIQGGNVLNVDVGVDSTFVHFDRERGFNVSRFDLASSLAVTSLHVGHVIGLRPQLKFREVLYSHGRQPSQRRARARGTFWLGLEAVSNLSRRFSVGQGGLRHTIKPSLFYEYVPASRRSDLPQIDAVDNLLKKHLVTYSVRTRLSDEPNASRSTTLLDLVMAQSYHLGDVPGQANIFSDVWTRTTLQLPVAQLPRSLSLLRLTFDAFYDPYDHEFTQLNSDVAVQAHRRAYVQVGHRSTRAGTVPRRGDIWNPLSFNEVLAPQRDAITFLTAGGAVRLPLGWTVGTKVYHDAAKGQTPEWDVVGLYQNPCKCWSLGLYYIRLAEGDNLPERNQFNFVLTLRGVGATAGLGIQVLQSILGPLLQGESGLPWASN